jgi:serine/threonine protein kinase
MTRCESCFAPETEGPLCTSCAKLVRSDIAMPLGARLQHGRYLLGRTLGDPGGFGVTYLGWDASLERRVAIKEYFPRHLVSRSRTDASASPIGGSSVDDYAAGLEGFLDEARRLAKLDHPDIVKVHDYCEANGTGYLVMNYYEGRDLRQHAERAGGTVDWQEAVSVMLPVLDGLAEVHSAGLIHRDIKPANIYLANLPDGKLRPILIDFGAARWATTTHELTSILTEGYAPLEQYPGCGPQGPYTDIYAAAATLHAVIVGRVPASAPSRLTHAYVPHLTDQVPGVPRRVGDAVEQAMSIQFDDRPQSAAEFARSLRAAAGVVNSRVIAPAPAPREASHKEPASGAEPGARSAVSHDTPTVPLTAASAQPVPGSPAGAAVRRSRSILIGYAVAAIAVVTAVALYVMEGGGRSAPEREGTADAAIRAEAAPHAIASRSALDAGDWGKAMSAAASLRTLALRVDAAESLRNELATRADSIAAVIATACPEDRAIRLRRESNVPACPVRAW